MRLIKTVIVMVPFLKWPAELFSNVFQCFPTSRTSHRESGRFGLDSGDAKQEDTIMDDLKVCLQLILLWYLLIVQFVRVWSTDPKSSPEAVVWHHSLDDVVKVIVPLPCHDGHKKLADLAVDKDGVERVLNYFETVRSLPLGSRDPMVLAQRPRDLTLKRVEACKQLRDAYRDRLEKDFDDQDPTGLERRLDARGRTWLERRLQSIVEVVDKLQNSVQVCPSSCACAEH